MSASYNLYDKLVCGHLSSRLAQPFVIHLSVLNLIDLSVKKKQNKIPTHFDMFHCCVDL